MSDTQARSATQGMIPAVAFVQPSGDLNAVSFRFLFSLYTSVKQLQEQVAALQGAVQTLQGPPEEASH